MPRHVVVDGSNLATEGRTMPSLKQLNDAVLAFIAEYPDDLVTVVVDATFGHRIAPSEIAEFDAAIENNELVCPPAGAIGRGDAFVITIAKKVNATILSNDSYQEFHGEAPWLFEDGRLLGGKPVPNVGWVFVARTPVRGPISRKAVRAKRGGGKLVETRHGQGGHRPNSLASQPMPTPKAPPPGPRRSTDAAPAVPVPAATAPAAAASAPKAQAPSKHEPINDALPFLAFVEAHPVGSTVQATVESYSSHGAYARAGEVRIYCPLRHMATPAPRAAREVLKLGEVYAFDVVSFNAARRSIDVAVPGFAPPADPEAAAAAVEAARAVLGTPVGEMDGVEAPSSASFAGDEPAAAESLVAAARKRRRRGGGAVSTIVEPVVEVAVEPVEPVVEVPVEVEPVGVVEPVAKSVRRRPSKKVAVEPVEPVVEPVAKSVRRRPSKKVAVEPVEPVVEVPVEVEPVGVVEPVAKSVRRRPSKKVAVEPVVEAPVEPAPKAARASKAAKALKAPTAAKAPKQSEPAAPARRRARRAVSD
jgi:hypothetical protein